MHVLQAPCHISLLSDKQFEGCARGTESPVWQSCILAQAKEAKGKGRDGEEDSCVAKTCIACHKQGAVAAAVRQWCGSLRAGHCHCIRACMQTSSMMVGNSTSTKPLRGAFILFEGGDRCGKTTQSESLVKHLHSKGVCLLLPARIRDESELHNGP